MYKVVYSVTILFNNRFFKKNVIIILKETHTVTVHLHFPFCVKKNYKKHNSKTKQHILSFISFSLHILLRLKSSRATLSIVVGDRHRKEQGPSATQCSRTIGQPQRMARPKDIMVLGLVDMVLGGELDVVLCWIVPACVFVVVLQMWENLRKKLIM